MSTSHVLVYGGSGALGRAIVTYFRNAKWTVTSIDFRANEEATNNVLLTPNLPLEKAGLDVLGKVGDALSGQRLDAILNVAGGWAGGNLRDNDIFKTVALMQAQTVDSSVIAARLAALHLREGGLLTLVGALAATGPTPGMIGYGLAKATVHQLIKSAAAEGSGLPAGAKVIGLLPVTLDTPANRAGMPKADFSSWTPLEHIAQKLLGWASNADSATNGALYSVETEKGATDFVAL
ncbi:hypothetical protein HDV00_002470 [Rhizophlyctis rosea]|nr:hypothetical protein HDV00_002470 [Rhizophlyctis rosea]